MKCSDAHLSSSWEPIWPEDTEKTLFDSPTGKGKLGSKQAHESNLRLGFDIWRKRDQIRKDLVLGDKGLIVGLICALIVRTGGDMNSLRGDIAALGGDHLYDLVRDLIEEFSGTDPDRHLWHKPVPDQYALTV